MKFVGSSLVSAMTHTPASGPDAPCTTPVMMPFAVCVCPCTPTEITAAANAASAIPIRLRRVFMTRDRRRNICGNSSDWTAICVGSWATPNAQRPTTNHIPTPNAQFANLQAVGSWELGLVESWGLGMVGSWESGMVGRWELGPWELICHPVPVSDEQLDLLA